MVFLLNSQAQGVSGKNEQSTQTPWPGAQCSCIGCIGLRPALLSILRVIVLLLRATPVTASLTPLKDLTFKYLNETLKQRLYYDLIWSLFSSNNKAALYENTTSRCFFVRDCLKNTWHFISSSKRCLKTHFFPSSVSEAASLRVFMCLNNLFGFSDSSAIAFEHSTHIAFPNTLCPQLQISPKRTHPLIVSASYMTVSFAYNSVPLNRTIHSAKQQSKFSIILRAVHLAQKSLRPNAFQK